MECCNCEEGVGDRTSDEDGWVSTAEFKAEPRSEDLVAIVDAMQELDRQRATLQRLVRLWPLYAVCALRRAALPKMHAVVRSLRFGSRAILLCWTSIRPTLPVCPGQKKTILSCGSTAT